MTVICARIGNIYLRIAFESNSICTDCTISYRAAKKLLLVVSEFYYYCVTGRVLMTDLLMPVC